MSHPEPDMADLTAGILAAWYGQTLPASAHARAGRELAALMDAFRRVSPPAFDTQAHHFAPLLEAIGDE